MSVTITADEKRDEAKGNELKQLTIDDLVRLAKQKRSIKHPLKKLLIEYILEVHIDKRQ